MTALFELAFFQRALIAALFTGLAAPVVGTYLVQRRLALMGDGVGHVAVTGVALGLVTGLAPTWTAVVVATLGAITIEVIRERGRTGGDVALALLFYGGIAGGILVTGLGGQSASTLNAYLFGSLTTLGVADVWFTIGLAAVVVALGIGLAPQLFAVAQDADFARVSGLDVRRWNMLVAVLAAVTVTVAMRTVGLLLVSALMVVPVAASQQLMRSFRRTLGLSVVLGVVSSVGGLLLAAWVSVTYDAQVATGATIVLLALAIFLASWPVGVLLRRRARADAPFPVPSDAAPYTEADDHDHAHGHVHGPGCGHRAVAHGDHVDYLHDGHRHAPHGEHYDEH